MLVYRDLQNQTGHRKPNEHQRWQKNSQTEGFGFRFPVSLKDFSFGFGREIGRAEDREKNGEEVFLIFFTRDMRKRFHAR